jgi:hypothetical protein
MKSSCGFALGAPEKKVFQTPVRWTEKTGAGYRLKADITELFKNEDG